MDSSEPDRGRPASPGPWPGARPPAPSTPPPVPAQQPPHPGAHDHEPEQQEDSRRILPWKVFHEVRALRTEVESLRAEREDRQGRLDKLYEVVHSLRADRTTELESAHNETARGYVALRDQIVGRCADVAAAIPDRYGRLETHVRLAAALFRTVLAEHPAAEEDWHGAAARVLGGDARLGTVTDLHHQTAELRADIAELGGVHRWNFELHLGRTPDTHLYDLWPWAEESEPLTLCVAPAYQVVGRTPHVRALVHTAIGG